MSRVLVTGGTGFIGRALSSALRARGRNVLVLSRKPADLKKILKGVETVYYLAGAKKNLRFHLSQPFTFVSQNVEPLLAFLEALKYSKVKKLIYLSSTIVEYRGEKDAPARHRKTSLRGVAGGLDGYVLGKYICEQLLAVYKQQFPLDIKIVRSTAVYGPGDHFDPETANFIPATIIKVAKAKGELPVWGQGKRKLQFIYIDDLIKNLLAVEKAKGDFFVFGNPESVSVNAIAKKIIRLSGKKLAIKNNWEQPDKLTRLIKFKNLIKPRFSLEKGLKRAIASYHEQ